MNKKYTIEFVGTFFLVLVIGLSAGNALAIGGILAAMVYMGGHVSGAHYNPAITLAVMLQKKISREEARAYMLVQLLASVCAALVYDVIIGNTLAVAPGHNFSFIATLLVEILFTFALVSVVLNTAISKQTKGNPYFGLAIGFVLMAAVFAGGKISGGAFNPAVGVGPNLYDLGSLFDNLPNILLYLTGPFLGGALASSVFTATSGD